MPIREARLADIPAIRALAIDTGMFPPDEAGFVDEMVPAALDGSMADNVWLVHTTDDEVDGAAYYAPEPHAFAVWNVYFIAVSPTTQGRGTGGELMAEIESRLHALGSDVARVVVVETSSTDQYARTRAFYPKQGYVEEARIREYYGAGDDKVVFWKSLV